MERGEGAITFVEHRVSLFGRRILVVDDDEDVRLFLAALLEDAGADVFAIGDGAAALDAARVLRPDLITLDLSMPARDGAEVLADLRGDDAVCEIPVCVITGRPELRRLIYDRPVRPPEGFETKPIDPAPDRRPAPHSPSRRPQARAEASARRVSRGEGKKVRR